MELAIFILKYKKYPLVSNINKQNLFQIMPLSFFYHFDFFIFQLVESATVTSVRVTAPRELTPAQTASLATASMEMDSAEVSDNRKRKSAFCFPREKQFGCAIWYIMETDIGYNELKTDTRCCCEHNHSIYQCFILVT